MNYEFQEFLVFEVASKCFGLPLTAVEEVVPPCTFTPIPKTAEFVKGLAAIRGKLMSVIDGSLRLGLGASPSNHFLICYVRGNQTAIIIDKPLEAGALCVRKLTDEEVSLQYTKQNVNPKLFKSGWQIFKKEEANWVATERVFLEIVADQFVSDQMASQLMKAG